MIYESEGDSRRAQDALNKLEASLVIDVVNMLDIVRASKCYHANFFVRKLITDHYDLCGNIIIDKLNNRDNDNGVLLKLAEHDIGCRLFTQLVKYAVAGSVTEAMFVDRVFSSTKVILQMANQRNAQYIISDAFKYCPSTKILEILYQAISENRKKINRYVRRCLESIQEVQQQEDSEQCET